jgi:prevent-host-death family protein
MSHMFNMHEAKSTLSRLVERALAGEEIVIARSGEPLVKLVPVVRRKAPRQPGKWRGKLWISEDFDRLPDETLAAFEGEAL